MGRADDSVSRDKRSEVLEISIGCRSVDGVDRGDSVDVFVGQVNVLEPALLKPIWSNLCFGVITKFAGTRGNSPLDRTCALILPK